MARCTLKNVALLTLSLAGAASGADFFPLQVGNIWIYQGTSFFVINTPQTLTITVAGTKDFDGVGYFVVRTDDISFQMLNLYPPITPHDRYLRPDDSGNIFEYDPLTKVEHTAYSLRASNAFLNRQLVGPLGTFDNAILFGYQVFQVGLYAEYFLPYVGMIRSSFATGENYDLVYAKLGGNTVFNAPQVSFSLSIDRSAYHVGDKLTATITFRSTELRVFTLKALNFYDLLIRDANDAVVYRQSDKPGFQLFSPPANITFRPGDKNSVLTAPLLYGNGAPLPPGDYTAEAFIVTPGTIRYRASVGFTIQ